MNVFLWNLFLALLWAAVTEQFTVVNLSVGFVLGYFLLWFSQVTMARRPAYFRKVPQLIGFVLFFLKELFVANLRVAYDVATPRYFMKPAVIAVPLEAKTDLEITLLANCITLTPGTLALDVSTDRKVLYIHSMYTDDADALRREIKDGLERRLLKLMR